MPGTAKGRGSLEPQLDSIKDAAKAVLDLAKGAATGCGVPGLEGALTFIVAIIDAVKVSFKHSLLLISYM